MLCLVITLESIIQKEVHQEESLSVALVLIFSTGLLNACTYISRGHVFASSQAGNLLYLGMDLAKGDFSQFVKYIFPVFLFGIGIFVTERMRYKNKLHLPSWRIGATVLEMVLILIASLLPDAWSTLANPIFSFVCGIQTISYRRIHNIPLATSNINANVKDALEHFSDYLSIKDKQDLFMTLLYCLSIIVFLGGIILGTVLSKMMGHYLSLLCIPCLIYPLGFTIHTARKNAQGQN